jgi:hypothetical protein
MIKLFLPILLLISFQFANAQNAAQTDSLVRALFSKPEEIQWVRYYAGRFDDVYAIRAVLGFDGTNCKGFWIYPGSKTSIRLEGALVGPQLRLTEKDNSQQTTGFLNANLDGKRLSGEWINHNNTLGLRVELQETGESAPPPDNCGDNKWINRYTGMWKNSPVELVLVRLHSGILLGQIWATADSSTSEFKGNISDKGVYSLESTPTPGKPLHWLEGELKTPLQTRGAWTTSNGDMRVIEFTLKENLMMSCREYADFLSSYDMLFPVTTSSGCNRWLSEQSENWVKHCRSAIQSKRLSDLPANRNVLRASMWPEISCWTDGVFSGYLNYTDSWSGPAQGLAFNFDLKNNKVIALESLFVAGFDLKTWADEYMRKESPKIPRFAEDPKFREWLYAEGFPLFSIRREGIRLSTLFHPIYGQQHLLVPYSALKPYLVPESPVAEFVK